MNPRRPTLKIPAGNVADAFLALLASRGVEYLFANAGTDFPSIVEGLARARADGRRTPTPVTVPHENAAIAMAHGYTLMTGRAQAVMVHVNVGTANTASALITASRENIPLLLAAGRTPISEAGPVGARSRPNHWLQESFDQAAQVREYVKWDYELRHHSDIETVIDRALQIAASDPKGPVYLSLPREVLAEETGESRFNSTTRLAAAAPAAPDPEAIRQCARWLGAARRPIIITNTIGRDPAAVAALASIADRFALPVVQAYPRYMNLAADHPMHLGYGPERFVEKADLVLLVEADVPWIPGQISPPGDCRVVQLGRDPAFARYPIRGFASDLTIAASAELGLGALEQALAEVDDLDRHEIDARRRRLEAEREQIRAAARRETESETGADGNISPAWATRQIFEACGEDAIYLSEYQMRPEWLPLRHTRSFFFESPSGALGWGLGAALGVKLAADQKLVVVGVGDGAYLFNNPAVIHQVSAAYRLPLLVVVFNNRSWNAVRVATLQMYPQGKAAGLNEGMALTQLTPSPDFEMYARASGGFGARVDKPEDLVPALAQALHCVVHEGRQALLNVMT